MGRQRQREALRDRHAVCEVSVFSGSGGYCTVGLMIVAHEVDIAHPQAAYLGVAQTSAAKSPLVDTAEWVVVL